MMNLMVNQRFATALHIMTTLGVSDGQLVQSSSLAKSIRANPVVVRTIIQSLTRAGLVKTTRGKFGGVELTKSPSKISLAEIYLSLNPPRVICNREKKADRNCPIGRCMDGIVHRISEELNDQIGDVLKRRKLSDIISEVV